jgi:hypothetical protein
MKNIVTNSTEAVTIETHTGMAVAHYLATMRKQMTIKNLAIKMNHADTGLIYRRLKQAEPDFEFMVNIMEAFGAKTLIEYVPAYAKEMLTHHAKIKHPEWFEKKGSNYDLSSSKLTMANEPNETYSVDDLEQENALLKQELAPFHCSQCTLPSLRFTRYLSGRGGRWLLDPKKL